MGIRDEKAPKALQISIKDDNGQDWGIIQATPKDFSTGSVGFYANSKVINPENPSCKYQIGMTITLIGSKGK
ncbi:MAG: hypothetical protein LBG90_01375 [Spirochaetaceae bacterium]|jgi:hypothetical protein|nr:hypothetical protein [Spirochaetaceae bacterium]